MWAEAMCLKEARSYDLPTDLVKKSVESEPPAFSDIWSLEILFVPHILFHLLPPIPWIFRQGKIFF